MDGHPKWGQIAEAYLAVGIEIASVSPDLEIVTGRAVDAWDVPREVGALAMRLLEQQRLDVWPPVTQLPTGRWLFLTRPHDGEVPDIEAHGTSVRHHGIDGRVVVPPSRGLRWIWAPRFPRTALPEADAVVLAFLTAASRLHPWEVRDESPAGPARS